ncbi:hypothetical protein FE840_008505 [Peteryoungia desertarenae]|uniref:Uncharacterized protein n=1 Tax=Peteryoungia desertarenae TaxID=1813451 RepID=A0ABX6QN71_9HYPH|nr:hypothetical protein [Peteryoungia desertarenae]QLF69580.1 hypothetical protein FE840_008505 [Peteryoungia desertarenae]
MSIERRRMENAIRSLLDNYPDPALHRWVSETVRAFDKRLSAIVDPRERDHAQQAALVLIKTTLQKWSENPPVRH